MKDISRNDEHYITKTQMAARMRVTSRTVDSWMAKGLLPFRKIGRAVRFDWGEVREHLKARNSPAVAVPIQQPGNGIAGLLRQRAGEIRRAEMQRRRLSGASSTANGKP